MKIVFITTGGTIDKTYNEHLGKLKNTMTVLDRILEQLRLPDIEIEHVEVMHKDSLEMVHKDREEILKSVIKEIPNHDAIIVTHGTDTLEETGDFLCKQLSDLQIPIVLTGAMKPFEFRDTDAVQNVTEALLATRNVNPGVYVAMHNRILQFPGVKKNREKLVFENIYS